ncbi:MAG: heavy-metal-associated domain-containing protein [Bacteroidota bacterium]
MKKIFFACALLLGFAAGAQINKVSLQASGLTCSMCSKAVKTALEKVSFVEKVMVDIKNQQYNLSFKSGQSIELDALSKAVEDAGFAVAKFVVSAKVENVSLQKDEHVKIGDAYFHFLNGENKAVNGETSFTVVDKNFLSPKQFKKYSGLTKMECQQTGRAAKCCTADEVPEAARVYHVII